jgi:hypothetical protein
MVGGLTHSLLPVGWGILQRATTVGLAAMIAGLIGSIVVRRFAKS